MLTALAMAQAGTAQAAAVSPAAVALPIPGTPIPAEHDLLKYGIVARSPGTDDVTVRHDLPFKLVDGRPLGLDLYEPAGRKPNETRPLVVFVNGIGGFATGSASRLKEWGQYTTWARLVASSGFFAATFDVRGGEAGATATADDLRDAFSYLASHAAEFGIAEGKTGVWACSANVREALAYVMSEDTKGISCAAIFYGISDVASIRPDIPVLFYRAGRDRASMNDAIDRMLARALRANAPWTIVNLPGGHHAFDILDDTPESRRAIGETLAFFAQYLNRVNPVDPARAVPATDFKLWAPVVSGAPGWAVPPPLARKALAHWFASEWQQSADAYGEWVVGHPDDATALFRLAASELELQRVAEAQKHIEKVTRLNPGQGEAWVILGRVQAASKQFTEAIASYQRAIAIDPRDAGAFHRLGVTQYQLGHYDEAVRTIQRSIELEPGNGWAINSLALACMKTRDWSCAIQGFEQVLAFAPTDAATHYNHACALARGGRRDAALDALTQAFQYGYKDSDAMRSDPDLASLYDDPRFQSFGDR